jgi:hypothetical protein
MLADVHGYRIALRGVLHVCQFESSAEQAGSLRLGSYQQDGRRSTMVADKQVESLIRKLKDSLHTRHQPSAHNEGLVTTSSDTSHESCEKHAIH